MRRVLRLCAALGLLLLLGGPTPGAVGSCGDDLSGFADPDEFCRAREDLTCIRRSLRGDLTEEGRDTCRRQVEALCAQRTFAPDCRPTRRQAEACLNALRARSTVDIKESELDECNTRALCTARTVGGSGDGGSD